MKNPIFPFFAAIPLFLVLSCSADVSFSDILKGNTLTIRATQLSSAPNNVEFILKSDGSLCTLQGDTVSSIDLAGVSVTAKLQDGSSERIDEISVPDVNELSLVNGVNVIPVSVNNFDESKITFAIFCYCEDELIPVQKIRYHNESDDLVSSFVSPVTKNYAIARTEVSFAKWKSVYEWALQNGYSFNNAGEGEDDSCPVRQISLRDARVWCNAASEKAGLTPVYVSKTNGTVLKDSREGYAVDNAKLNDEGGYRLPTADEFAFAAKGGKCAYYASTMLTKPYSDFSDEESYKFKWAGTNDEENIKTFAQIEEEGAIFCGQKEPNSLHIYDMTGNAAEWSDTKNSDGKYYVLGGSFFDTAETCTIDNRTNSHDSAATSDEIGFRLARSITE